MRFFALGHHWARPVPVVHTWGNVLVGRIGPLQASRELFETNEIPPERILGRQKSVVLEAKQGRLTNVSPAR